MPVRTQRVISDRMGLDLLPELSPAFTPLPAVVICQKLVRLESIASRRKVGCARSWQWAKADRTDLPPVQGIDGQLAGDVAAYSPQARLRGTTQSRAHT